MKVNNWRNKVGASLVAAGLLSPAAARALDIPLADPSFEAFVVPQSGPAAHYAYSDLYRPTSAWIDDQDSPADRIQDDGDGNWLYDAAYSEFATKRGAPRTGSQAMHGRFGYNSQEVASVFEAGKTYTFSVYAQGDDNSVIVGDATSGPGWDSRVWLYIFNGSLPFSEADSLTFARYSPAGDRFNRNDFINRPVGATAAQSRALWRQISISHTVYADSPELGQPIGVAFWGGPDAGVDDASLSVDVTVLTLEVNTSTGVTRILNETGKPVYLDYYEITSASSSLNEAAWNSLQNQNLSAFPAGNGSGNGWEEAGGSSDAILSETYLSANSQLAAAGSINLGAAFATSDPLDLVFRYGRATASTSADFDADGDVDGNDFLRWQRGVGAFGAGVTKASGNANTDATVNAADLAIWKNEVGATGVPTQTGVLVRGHVRYVAGSIAAVPEPGGVILVGWAAAGLLARKKR